MTDRPDVQGKKKSRFLLLFFLGLGTIFLEATVIYHESV
jgi:hypothetical protein